MAYLNFQQHTHSDRLERWLGRDNVATVSAAMRDWYGPPIALHGVPGNVMVCKGGDFIGRIDRGRPIPMLVRRGEMATYLLVRPAR